MSKLSSIFWMTTLIGAILFVNIISAMSTAWDSKSLSPKSSDDSSVREDKWNLKQVSELTII